MNDFGGRSREVVSFEVFQRRHTERQLTRDISGLVDLAFFVPRRIVAPFLDAMLGLEYHPPEKGVVPLFRYRGEKPE